jgi:glyoxylate reductase
MKPKVFLTRKITDEVVSLLQKRHYRIAINRLNKPVKRNVLLREIKDANALLCMLADRIDRELMDAAPQLKVISHYAVGVDNIDVDYATRKGVIVTNTPGVLTETTAEVTWALILAVARRIAEADHFIRKGNSWIWSPALLLGRNINGKTLGIIGCGRIGQAVGLKAPAFGMKILYYNRSARPDFEKTTGARKVSLDTLLRNSDFVSLHLPLTARTKHFIGIKELRRMKPTAFLINVARGPIVNEPALVYALQKKIIAGAGLDVYEKEPIVHPGLLKFDNVTLLPHLGSATVETRTRMAIIAVENIIAALDGQQPKFAINYPK